MKLLSSIRLSAFLLISLPCFSQDGVQTCIDFYWGGPQMQPALANSSLQYVRARGFGPFGGRIEFFPTERHSVGLEVNYLQINFSSPEPFHVRENNYKTGKVTNDYTMSKTRIYVRYAYHIVKNDRVDFYCHAAIGASIWSPKQVSIEENYYNNGSYSGYSNSISYESLIPIAIRTGIGVRVYLNKYMGFNFDMGIGGALLTGGLTVRIPGSSK